MLCIYRELNANAYPHFIKTIVNALSGGHGAHDQLKHLSIPTNNYILYIIEGCRSIGQDSVLLFAAVFIYQILCYLQRRSFSLNFFIKVFIIRMSFVLIWNSNILFWIISASFEAFKISKNEQKPILSFYLPFPIFRKSIEFLENCLLTCLSLTPVRVAFRVINFKEIAHMDNHPMNLDIEMEYFQKVLLAIKLFKILPWLPNHCGNNLYYQFIGMSFHLLAWLDGPELYN